MYNKQKPLMHFPTGTLQHHGHPHATKYFHKQIDALSIMHYGIISWHSYSSISQWTHWQSMSQVTEKLMAIDSPNGIIWTPMTNPLYYPYFLKLKKYSLLMLAQFFKRNMHVVENTNTMVTLLFFPTNCSNCISLSMPPFKY